MGRRLPLLVLVISSLFTLSSNGLIKKDAQESYTIRKGDTLWKVADHFLDNPERWPEIWKANPQISNPHLLFPGDVVRLVYVDGKPQLMLSRREIKKAKTESLSEQRENYPTIKLTPKIRVETNTPEIPVIHLHTIKKFLEKDRIITANSGISKAPHIFALNHDKLAATTGDRVYAKGAFPEISGSYEIIRLGKKIKDPTTGEVLAVIGIKSSDAQVTSVKRDIASLTLIHSRSPVKKGDSVVVQDSFVPPAVYYPKPPTEAVTGKILSITRGGTTAGKYDTVIINLGQKENLRPGNILAVQQSPWVFDSKTKKKIKLPNKQLGTLMVYRPFDKLSYAIVLSAAQELEVGNFLTNP